MFVCNLGTTIGQSQAQDVRPSEFATCGVIFAVGDSVGMFLAAFLLGLSKLRRLAGETSS